MSRWRELLQRKAAELQGAAPAAPPPAPARRPAPLTALEAALAEAPPPSSWPDGRAVQLIDVAVVEVFGRLVATPAADFEGLLADLAGYSAAVQPRCRRCGHKARPEYRCAAQAKGGRLYWQLCPACGKNARGEGKWAKEEEVPFPDDCPAQEQPAPTARQRGLGDAYETPEGGPE